MDPPVPYYLKALIPRSLKHMLLYHNPATSFSLPKCHNGTEPIDAGRRG